ncbi:MAG: hypothetical protein LBR38_00120 [Synergistaceae bacterium]|jgi:hypothetical protein|nr:hypothetical protein [Synergistaceae bacterium]
MEAVGALAVLLKERYGSSLEIAMVDPRNLIALWDNIRYGVRPARPTWVLGKTKIFDGIPEAAVLTDAIDRELAARSA